MAEDLVQTLIFTSYRDWNEFEYFFFPGFGELEVTEDMEKDLELLLNDVLLYLNDFYEIDRLTARRWGIIS